MSGRGARIERLGLTATTLVLSLGLWLTHAGQTASSADRCATATDTSPACVDLTAVTDPGALVPLLTIVDDPAERRVVADAVASHLAAHRGEIEHVGGLAEASIPAATVRGNPRLATLNARLEQRGDDRAVPALTAAQIAAIKPSLIVRTPADYATTLLLALAGFMSCFWTVHVVRALAGRTGDPILLPAVHLLTGLGLMAMIALRDPLRDMMLVVPMAGGIAVGCGLWLAAAFVDFEHPRLRRLVLPPLAIAVALALALVVFGSGPTGSGAKVNLFGVQPVEAIRLLVAFSLAAYFARRWSFLREFSESVGPRPVRRHLRLPRWKDARPLVITIATLLLFFFLQRDLGPALVLSCVFLGLYGLSRARAALVVAGFAALAVGFTVGYWLGVPATVTRRVALWLDPWNNALPGGDQIAHGLWALATGGAWGVGPGVGDPQLIPAGHTDLVVATLGEELGAVGVVCAIAVFALLVCRLLRVARRAAGDYTFFLAMALTLGLAVQAIVITAGMLGLLPLAGVVTPFLSYGRSAMLCNFAAVAVCAAISLRTGEPRASFAAPSRILGWSLALAALMLVTRAGLVQVVYADTTAAHTNLTQQADGGLRYQYNPRLVAAGRMLPRGSILDRTGLPIASSNPAELPPFAARYKAMGVPATCTGAADARCYPLGALAFHLIGDADRQLNWAARNTSFAEQDFDARLKGFDDHPQVVTVTHPRDGRSFSAVRRDYAELLPLVRHKGNPDHASVREILGRDRSVRLTIDAALQVSVARAVRERALASGSGHGAAVVLDPATGALLAAASYPWPERQELTGERVAAPDRLLDRARYGLYPPGSTFKLVTAVAALRSEPAAQRSTFDCVRLPDGRVGGHVPGQARPVRDDPQDTTPHGRLDMHRALVVSCNAYFASLAQRLGSKALAEAAAAAQISVAAAPVEQRLPRSLAHAGYGQGEVVATPLRMARATAAIASDGMLHDVHVRQDSAGGSTRWVSADGAALLRRDMRAVVTSGTGRALAQHPVPIAGKTGTAEVDGARSHAWFVGFAPYREERQSARIAFAVVVEQAGYGGRVAAPLAGDIVNAARAGGLLK